MPLRRPPHSLRVQVGEALQRTQNAIKGDLVRGVRAFAVEVVQLRNEFLSRGPATAGPPPSAAVDRLAHFMRVHAEAERRRATFQQVRTGCVRGGWSL